MQNMIRADAIKKGHYIINPLIRRGESLWTEVQKVEKDNNRLKITCKEFSIHRLPQEGITVKES